MHLGSDPSRFHWQNTQPAVRDGRRRIGFLGRLSPEKGLVLALRAWAYVAGSKPFGTSEMADLGLAVGTAWCDGTKEQDHEETLRLHVFPSENSTQAHKFALSCSQMREEMQGSSWSAKLIASISGMLRLYLEHHLSNSGRKEMFVRAKPICYRTQLMAAGLRWAFPAFSTDVLSPESDCELQVWYPNPDPEARFRLVGSGNIRSSLADLAARLGISSSIEMPGAVYGDSLAAELQGMRAMVFPSVREESETFGISNLENLLLGVPFVSMGLGGSVEYSMHGYNSLITPASSSQFLALQLLAFLGGRTAHPKALHDFVSRHGHTIEQVGSRYARLIGCLASCPRLSIEGDSGLQTRISRLSQVQTGGWSYAAASRAGAASVSSLECAHSCAASIGT